MPTDRPNKELMFIPALLLLALVWGKMAIFESHLRNGLEKRGSKKGDLSVVKRRIANLNSVKFLNEKRI